VTTVSVDRLQIAKAELAKFRDLSLYDCIKELVPTIQKRNQGGVPLMRLYEIVANTLGCSADAVARHYRRAAKATSDSRTAGKGH
jgi:hypothetical protein